MQPFGLRRRELVVDHLRRPLKVGELDHHHIGAVEGLGGGLGDGARVEPNPSRRLVIGHQQAGRDRACRHLPIGGDRHQGCRSRAPLGVGQIGVADRSHLPVVSSEGVGQRPHLGAVLEGFVVLDDRADVDGECDAGRVHPGSLLEHFAGGLALDHLVGAVNQPGPVELNERAGRRARPVAGPQCQVALGGVGDRAQGAHAHRRDHPVAGEGRQIGRVVGDVSPPQAGCGDDDDALGGLGRGCQLHLGGPGAGDDGEDRAEGQDDQRCDHHPLYPGAHGGCRWHTVGRRWHAVGRRRRAVGGRHVLTS